MTYRPPIVTGQATVERVEPIAPRMLRVTLAGEAWEGYRPDLPAEAFRLMLPPAGATHTDLPSSGPDGLPQWSADQTRPMLRAFTVRHVGEDGRVAFDVMRRHRDRWGDALWPHAPVGISGMRFGYAGDLRAGRHALVGDRGALPAIAAVLDALPAEASAAVVLVGADKSELAVLRQRAGIAVHPTAAHQVTATLRRALGDIAPDHLYAAGEVQLVAAAYRVGRDELGLTPDRLQPVVHWQHGLSADQRDPLIYLRYQAAAREGRDVSDPALVADLELTGVGADA